MRVLITGGLGWTAKAIIETLSADGHQVIVLDLPGASTDGTLARLMPTTIRGNIANPEVLQEALRGIDTVVHLAIATGENDYSTPDIPFRVNVQGMYNLCEAARQHKLRKLILMSSAPVHLNWSTDTVISAYDPLPTSSGEDHLYDLTKRLQENIVHDYAQNFGIQAIVLRAGHIVDSHTQTDPHHRALVNLTYCRGGWVCRYDLAEATRLALRFDAPGYHAFHIISDRRAEHRFELAEARQTLGLVYKADFSTYSI